MVTGQLVKCTWLVASQWKQKLDSARGTKHTHTGVCTYTQTCTFSLTHTQRDRALNGKYHKDRTEF